MSKQRLIVKLPGPVLGLTKPQRDHIKAEIREWYEGGADPLLIPTDCEVYGFTDEWEHKPHWSRDDFNELLTDIRQHEAHGWQVAAMSPKQEGYFIIFKRPKPLEDPDDE